MTLFFYLITLFNIIYACTIGVTRDIDDGLILWKNRDLPFSEDRTTLIEYIPGVDGNYGYTQVVTPNPNYENNSPYMGLNDQGFAIVNSIVQRDDAITCNQNARDIDDEYKLIREALETCSDIECFDSLVDSLESTDPNNCHLIIDSSDCDSHTDCYWQDGNENCDEGCFPVDYDNHIQSNFAVIDSVSAAIFEVDTYNDTSNREDLNINDNAIFRSNHFKYLQNPPALNDLNTYSCGNSGNFEDVGSLLLGNKWRYCASENYFSSLSTPNDSKIKFLIQSDPSLNDNRGAYLRSLSRKGPNDDNELFYELPYYDQNSYDCGMGRPSGYVYSSYSIARSKTTTSMVAKVIPGDIQNSFMLVSQGNPLFNPYIPIKISDFNNVNDYGNDFDTFNNSSEDMYGFIYDYGNDPDPNIKRWIDTQHLKPTSSPTPNHDGTFIEIDNLELGYIDFNLGELINHLNTTTIGTLHSYYTSYVNGFNTGGFDDPRYKVVARFKDASGCTNGIWPDSYSAERIINRTFHRDHNNPVSVWRIEDYTNNAIYIDLDYSFDTHIINPIITEMEWHSIRNEFGDNVNIKLLDSSLSSVASLNNQLLGCSQGSFSCANNADIDDGSCSDDLDGNGICDYIEECSGFDLNFDSSVDVVDIIIIVNCILGQGPCSICYDINFDAAIDVSDIVLIVNLILQL